MSGEKPSLRSFVFGLCWHRLCGFCLGMFGAIAPLAQNAFDLRHNLRVGKVRAGNRAGGARRHTRAAALTQCRVNPRSPCVLR
jgi:hypothetical protein